MCDYTNMEQDDVIDALLALGQGTRLSAYRLLVEYGPQGLSVSDIAAHLGVNLSTLSRHLAQLERARLLRSWRRERQVFYAVDDDGTDALLRFLTEDCCKATMVDCDAPPPRRRRSG